MGELLSPARLKRDVEALASGESLADPITLLTDALGLFRPPSRISTVEWAETYRKFRTTEGGALVPYDRWRTPYNIAKMDALDEPGVELVVVVKPSRSGGTTVAENYLGKMIQFGPMGDVGWYLGSADAVKKYCDRIVKPMFEDHPDLAARIGTGKSDNNDTSKRIAGHLVEWLPANDQSFRNREFLFGVMDEPDGWTRFSETPETQLKGRQKNVGRRRKGMIMSHPDKGWKAGVAPTWESSSRGIYVMQCAECEMFAAAHATKFWPDVPEFKLHYQRDERASVDDRLALAGRTAGMACPHCGSVLDDKQRFAMVDQAAREGWWMHRGQRLDPVEGIVGEVEPHTKRGFWDHGLMLKVNTAAELAKGLEEVLIKYERSGGSREATKAVREYMAKHLCEIFGGKAGLEGVTSAGLVKRARAEERAALGLFPAEALFITAAVDVGAGKFDVSFRAWDLESRSWWIDRLTLRQRLWPDGRMRDIRTRDRIEDWEEALIDDVILRTFPIEGAEDWLMPVAAVAIDVSDGNVTWKGREFARRCMVKGLHWGTAANPWSRVRLIQGSPNARAPILPVKATIISRDENGKAVKPTVQEWTIGAHQAKELALERLAVSDGGPGQCWFAPDIGANYFDEYFNEPLIDGKFVRQGPNESLDCFDEMTEVLTNQGWKQFSALTGEETIATVNLASQLIEYQKATNYIARRHVGEMVEIKGRRLDILVTPNHRMVTFKERYNSAEKRWNFDVPPQITLAKDLTLHHQLMVAADWRGSDVSTVEIPASYIEGRKALIAEVVTVDACDLAEFLGWFVSEGGTSCFRSKTQGNVRRRVGIYQQPGAKADVIRACLARLPWAFTETVANGCIRWVCASKQLYEYVTAECGGGVADKRVPDWIRAASPTIIRRFVDAAILGDGWQQSKPGQRKHRTYATISRNLADGMQELFIKLGCAANIKVRPGATCKISSRPDRNGRDQYHVSELKRRKASLEGGANGARSYIGRNVPFDGMVYCVTVPNGTLVCRRNGKSFIAGNCFGYEEAVRLMLKPDRKDINWADPARRPPWARPIPHEAESDQLPQAGGRTSPDPAEPKPSILSRFDGLNQGNRR